MNSGNKSAKRLGFRGITAMAMGALVAACNGADAAGSEPAARTDEELSEPSTHVLGMLGSAIDPAVAAELGSFRPGHGALARVAMACDAQPKMETTDLCGHPVIRDAHFSWTGCTVPLHDGAHGVARTTSGTLDLTTDVEGACHSGAPPILVHEHSFRVEREMGGGIGLLTRGTATARRTHAASHASSTVEVKLDVTREVKRGEHVMGSGSVVGTMRATIDRASHAHTVNGTANLRLPHAHHGATEGTIELVDVVHPSPDSCPWPLSGTIVHTIGEKTHALQLGPTCGEATVEGKRIDLTAVSHHAMGRHQGHH
jgi:hypothetical protein